jgi:RNA polymerase sigma factor (sigma-70 family)
MSASSECRRLRPFSQLVYRKNGQICLFPAYLAAPKFLGEAHGKEINNFVLLNGYGYGLQMFSIASVNPKAIDSQERPDRHPEGLVEDFQGIYEKLIAPMESRMMRSIWRVVRNSEMAEDTLQDALTVIWKKLHQVCSHPNPRALILKICLNAAYDKLRRNRHYLHHEEISTLRNTPISPDRGAMRVLAARELEDQVLRAIAQLPRKQALALWMRILQEESFEVIAHTLGCSEITARLHVSKGRTRLRRLLAHLDPSAGKEASDE